MKLLIASDIHGSYYYLEKVIDFYKKGHYDKLILLGDILYHGARNDLPEDYQPKKVFALLNTLKDEIIAIKGNCDSEVDEMVLEFPLLEKTRLFIDGKDIFLEHGHHLGKYPQDSIVISGHTHVKRCEYVDGVLYLNPGSISIPKDDSASFLVFDKEFIFYDVE